MKSFKVHTIIMLGVALIVRLLVWRMLPYRDWISDEAEYWSAATWLAQGRGFAFFDQWIWTRPPLYVLFLAVHIKLFGVTALWSVRLSQAIISVITVWLAMLIARRLAPQAQAQKVAVITGWAMTIAYSFATYSYLILSETLFLLLFLAGVWLLIRWAQTDAAATRQRWGLLLAAGGVFGLATLTRAIMLTWLPLCALWVIVQAHRTQNHNSSRISRFNARSLIPAVVLACSVCLVVLPWTAYTTSRWGGGAGLIMVDTTGGYNFALGAQSATPDGRNENKLHDDLCGGTQCDNQHAARQSAAYALGWQLIRDNLQGFIAKTGRELLDMLQLRFGGAERMTKGYTVGAVALPHLVGLVLDDTLYVLALGFAVVGLFRRQQRAGKGLVLTWLGYNVAVGALVFAINRFRLPLMPFVFIYAACGVVQLREAWQSQQARRWAIGTTALLLLVVAPSYFYMPPAISDTRAIWTEVFNTINGQQAAAQCNAIEQTMRSGDLVQARKDHDAFDSKIKQIRPNGLDCLALINVQLLELEGQRDQALRLVVSYNDNTNPVQSARVLMLEGTMYQRLGQLADAAARLNFRTVEIINDLDWAWQHLTVVPTATLDLGSGFDYGYVRGFYQSEHASPDFRWSGADASVRFPQAGTGQAQTLRLHVRGTTMPTVTTPHISGQALPPITLPSEWNWIDVALPPTPIGQDVVVQFSSNVFINGPQELAERVRSTTSDPLRLLGFQLDRAELGSGKR